MRFLFLAIIAKALAITLPVVLGTLAVLIAVLYKPLVLRITVLGISRSFGTIKNIHGTELQTISGTWYCEDLHYHQPSNLLFAAPQENDQNRWKWFPPMDVFDDPKALGRGTVVVIDPNLSHNPALSKDPYPVLLSNSSQTFKARRLSLKNFSGLFNTHGIDVWSPEDDPSSIFIFAVNHLPNPAYKGSNDKDIPKVRSRIELFHHVAGTSEAKHLRSIWHPLIRTPNDIYARNATSFYFTNDHYYRGGFMKLIEDIGYQSLAAWTDLVHIGISDLNSEDDGAGVVGTVAAKGIHNNNGLGSGRNDNEILIADASAGILVLAKPSPHPYLSVTEFIQLPCTIDNPSYFSDPYAQETGRDASGYVLAGLAQAAAFPNGLDPVMVWLVQLDEERHLGGGVMRSRNKKGTQKLVFQDDGRVIRSAATAVLIAIDPKENAGKKQAGLVITGPVGKAIVTTKIDI